MEARISCFFHSCWCPRILATRLPIQGVYTCVVAMIFGSEVATQQFVCFFQELEELQTDNAQEQVSAEQSAHTKQAVSRKLTRYLTQEKKKSSGEAAHQSIEITFSSTNWAPETKAIHHPIANEAKLTSVNASNPRVVLTTPKQSREPCRVLPKASDIRRPPTHTSSRQFQISCCSSEFLATAAECCVFLRR